MDKIKVERHDSDDNELMIDDDDYSNSSLHNIVDIPECELGDDQVALEKLPRPVQDLNCRQARTYLVKLLRAANGGNNPHYGNPDMKPPFWPDFYWPWERLTDVHTKPRTMAEPLQYSEMMKLAIERGYQFFGYDPKTYILGEHEAEPEGDPLVTEPIVNINCDEQPFIISEEFDSKKFYLKQPPKLPRPLSKINCVQARTALAKLLRYQQCGNNPVYGSPDTEPPWWPNDMIRWVDMVDLRGKPPYLPDTKSYTDVLKIAIGQACAYYGYDPELFIEAHPSPTAGLIGDKQRMFPVIPAAGIAPPKLASLAPMTPSAAPALTTSQYIPIRPKPAAPVIEPIPAKLQNIILPPMPSLPSAPVPQAALGDFKEDLDEDDDDMGEMPPKLPMPVGKMNCSLTRTCLAKLIRFHCGRGQMPNYGNPASMPVWWPNHIIDWSKIKNLSHRYEGYLGNTYSNCLRIAMIRGYAHYGLDANEYVESKGGGGALDISYSNDEIMLTGTPVINGQPLPQVQPPQKKALPMLIPLSSMVCEGQYPRSLLGTRDWFPPRLAYSKAIDASGGAIKSLKPCKVLVDQTFADRSDNFPLGGVKESDRISDLFQYFYEDLERQKFTDISLVASKKTPNRPKEIGTVKVHKFILAAHSPKLKRMMEELNEEDSSLVLSGVNGTILRLIVEALYTGKVVLDGITQLRQFEGALRSLHSFGILLNLRPAVYFESQENIEDTEEQDVSLEADVDLDQQRPSKRGKKDRGEDSESEPQTRLSKRAKKEDTTPKDSPDVAKTYSKRSRKEPEQSPETNNKKTGKNKDDDEAAEECPKKRTRASLEKKKDEATKPNFDAVTIEAMNEKVKEGQLAFVKWLQKEGFLRKVPPECCVKDCHSTMTLTADETDSDGVTWACPKNEDHAHISIREGSIFGRNKKSNSDSLSWIIQIILCWSDNTSLGQCQQLTGADVDKIFLWYDECRDYYGAL